MSEKPELQELAEEAREPVGPVAERGKKCDHVNAQSYGLDGKLDKLRCVLEYGHPGDHFAKHRELREKVEVEADAFWGDAAGEPA